MAPPRRISREQLEVMIDFLEQNKGMCMGAPSNGTMASAATSAHNAVRQTWHELGKLLNAVPGGALKTADGWKKYWFEWRHKSRKKANDARRFEENPHGGPSRFAPLNDLEVRVLALSGSNLVRSKSKPIKELENMLADNSDSDPIGHHSPEHIKAEPLPIHKVHKKRSSTKGSTAPDEARSSTPPPQWALELEERRIAAEERMAAALESIASIMRLQEERRSMLDERLADTLTSVAGNFQELNSGIQEAVMHLQRLHPVQSNGPDIKDHVFI
ncbi:uncharacterized protein LOC125227498 [Leguminivora glycinivorella]|uniref:uncharacterized protein LOC125227498 n=1 Tax=Leguminivora glycinivorella TaxID=1035111 RepID=UPI00200BCD39|nr:uncharacterized protein LOC125227498 [Leguminivora glycinivorella]